MSVKQRGTTGTAWEVYVKRGEARYRLSARTEAQGKVMEQEIIAALEAGREPDMESIRTVSASGEKTFGSVIDIVTARYWTDTAGGEAARINIAKVAATIGREKPIARINNEDVDMVVTSLEKRGNSNATINRALSALSKVHSFASKRRWVTGRLDLERRPEAEGRVRFLSSTEEAALCAMTRQIGCRECACSTSGAVYGNSSMSAGAM